MKMLNNAATAVSKVVGRKGLLLKAHSPEILMGMGIVGVVTSTVLACKATLKADDILQNSAERLEKVKYAKENFDVSEYSEKDYQRDLTIVYAQTGINFAKLYGPALTVGIISIGCLLGAHNIMQKRNVALMAAYSLLEKGFDSYRKRVVEDFGAEVDHMYKNGLRNEVITTTETDAEGKTKKVKTKVKVKDPNSHSVYAKIFDESSKYWSKTPEYNAMHVRAQQNYANDMLRARGHLFLNEVYDMLDIPRTQAGSVVGWVMSPEGDNFVDFGLYDTSDGKVNDFMNGYESSVLLDFNVDGVIYDLI